MKDTLLTRYTGHDSVFWVRRVQGYVKDQMDLSPDEIHPVCWPQVWIARLADDVMRAILIKRPNSKYDENICCAASVAIILVAWSVRIGRAKAHDPRRPVRLRRKALGGNRELAQAVNDAVFDETSDAKYFEQPWEYPYMKGATNGSFR